MRKPAKANRLSTGETSDAELTCFETRLAGYAIAVASAFSIAPGADAAVIYTNPADTTLLDGSLEIDLNADAVSDIRLTNFLYGSVFGASVFLYRYLTVDGLSRPNAGVVASGFYAAALPSGATIGPGQTFHNVQFVARSMAFAYRYSTAGGLQFGLAGGPWANISGAFLGLRFDIGGNTHYGWARFSVSADDSPVIAATLHDFAYESTVDAGILAGDTGGVLVPEPNGLGLLALGSAGLALWRTRKKNNQRESHRETSGE